jgi:trehalose 6-phosphate synthase
LKKVSKGDISWASFNLSEEDHELYYNQFSNGQQMIIMNPYHIVIG